MRPLEIITGLREICNLQFLGSQEAKGGCLKVKSVSVSVYFLNSHMQKLL